MNKLLCAAEPRGDVGAVQRLLATAADQQADAVLIVADLSADGGRESHRETFRALGAGGLPAYGQR